MAAKRQNTSHIDHMFFMRKRKTRDEDSTSLHSFAEEESERGESPKPEVKRKRGLAKVTSFASILSSPIRPIRKAGSALQRSISGVWASPCHDTISQPRTPSRGRKALNLDSTTVSESLSDEISPPTTPSGKRRLSLVSIRRMSGVSLISLANPGSGLTPYKLAPPTPTRSRALRLWSHTVSAGLLSQLDSREIRRQEAIFELYQGEVDLVEDLRMVMHTYRDSLLNLGILNPVDAKTIFGDLEQLIVVHQELINDLKDTRDSNEVFCSVGYCLSNWTPQLSVYFPYCSNQIKARHLLEEKKQKDAKFADFLQRCLDSPFSRKLDLWSFLDVPRGRLVKYPLLVKQIAKYSNECDLELINVCLKELGSILERANFVTGQARCDEAKQSLSFGADAEHQSELYRCLTSATNLVCEGALRNMGGTKLQCFLFDTCFVVARPTCQAKDNPSSRAIYLVQNPPLPMEEVTVVIGDKESRNGNFLSSSTNVKFTFRVETPAQSHILSTTNEANRKQWIQCLTRFSEKAKSEMPPKPEVKQAKRESTEPKIKGSLLSLKRLNKKNLRSQPVSAPNLGERINDKENKTGHRKRTFGSLPLQNATPPTQTRRSARLTDEKLSNLRTICTRSMTNVLIP